MVARYLSGKYETHFRTFLHHQISGNGNGADNLPFYCRSAWGLLGRGSQSLGRIGHAHFIARKGKGSSVVGRCGRCRVVVSGTSAAGQTRSRRPLIQPSPATQMLPQGPISCPRHASRRQFYMVDVDVDRPGSIREAQTNGRGAPAAGTPGHREAEVAWTR
jgi:hypothetical protein